MKNLIVLLFIAFFFQSGDAFGQKGILINTNQEISLLVQDSDGNYVENIILQVEKNHQKDRKGIHRIDNLKYSYDGKTLVIQMNEGSYIYTIDESIKGKNVTYGYGISRKYGDLKFKENLLEKGGDVSAFDLVYIVGQVQLSRSFDDDPTPKRCTSGGQGATSCGVSGGIGTVDSGCEVSCFAGNYACCDSKITVCKCFKVGTGPAYPSTEL